MPGITTVLVLTTVLALASCGPSEKAVPKGFTILGQVTDTTTKGNRAATLTYYLSDDPATQGEALADCIETFGGRLATPLNTVQLDAILNSWFSLNLLPEHLWSSARADGIAWFWLTTNKKIATATLRWNPASDKTPTYNFGLTIWPNLSYNGFTRMDSSVRNRYICEV